MTATRRMQKTVPFCHYTGKECYNGDNFIDSLQAIWEANSSYVSGRIAWNGTTSNLCEKLVIHNNAERGRSN